MPPPHNCSLDSQTASCTFNLHSRENVGSLDSIAVSDEEGAIFTTLHEVFLRLHSTDVLVVPYSVGRRHPLLILSQTGVLLEISSAEVQ